MKNIVLVGLIYDNNLGDPAIYEVTKRYVDELTNHEIRKLDLYGRTDFATNITSKDKKTIIKKKIIIKIKRFINVDLQPLRQEIKNVIDGDSEAVIFVGGGLIKYSNVQPISRYVGVVLDKCEKMNIPVMFSAVGVEGYDTSDACQILKRKLNYNCIKYITTRDDIDNLKKYIERSEIHTALVADPALNISKYYTGKQKHNKTIGLNIARRHIFENYGLNPIDDEYVMSFWIHLYNHLSELGFKPILYTNGYSGDTEFAREIAEKLAVNTVFEPQNLAELCDLISSFEFAFVTRLHSAILCTSYKVPSISFVWNNKQSMFGRIINMDDCFVSLADKNVDYVISLFEKYKDREILISQEYLDSTKNHIRKFLQNIKKE